MPCLTIAAALARRLEGQATVVAMANPVFENAVAANVRFIGVGSRDEYECVQRDHASRRDARVVVRYWLDHLETHAARILEARRGRWIGRLCWLTRSIWRCGAWTSAPTTNV